MALDIPEQLEINPFDCRWDPIDPHGCFDERSCGCYMDPCDYFDIPAAECELDTCDPCSACADTCVEGA